MRLAVCKLGLEWKSWVWFKLLHGLEQIHADSVLQDKDVITLESPDQVELVSCVEKLAIADVTCIRWSYKHKERRLMSEDSQTNCTLCDTVVRQPNDFRLLRPDFGSYRLAKQANEAHLMASRSKTLTFSISIEILRLPSKSNWVHHSLESCSRQTFYMCSTTNFLEIGCMPSNCKLNNRSLQCPSGTSRHSRLQGSLSICLCSIAHYYLLAVRARLAKPKLVQTMIPYVMILCDFAPQILVAAPPSHFKIHKQAMIHGTKLSSGAAFDVGTVRISEPFFFSVVLIPWGI